jgi:hypothetical protein
MTWSMCDLALWLFLIIAICSVQQGELSPCYRTILYAFARFLRDVTPLVCLAVQRPHDANPRYHRWAAALGRPASADGPRKASGNCRSDRRTS